MPDTAFSKGCHPTEKPSCRGCRKDKDDFSDDDYVTYTLENGKLTFTELTGDVLDFADAADMIEDFLPLVFTKQ